MITKKNVISNFFTEKKPPTAEPKVVGGAMC